MDCGLCKIQLVPLEDLCFYYKREKVVELMIKHEKSTFFEDKFKFILEKGERFNIFCLNCNFKIGTKHVFGPHHAEVMAFGQRVSVLDRKITGKDRWYHLYKSKPYIVIPIRYTDNFYGYKLTEMLSCAPQANKIAAPIKWPDPVKVSNFTYDDIIMSEVVPRDYQITAYIEALQRDFVLVLPTGYGKTLVASLVAARMKKLNPDSMVLFLVDRIPLVFQQAESISTDTHLRVCPITSESNTNLKRRQLNHGFYDVMVSTAGAYLALERDVNIQNFCLVIFDECHHATKSHDYVLLLKLIRDRAPDDQNRPRVLGLTASPPSTKGSEKLTKELLDEFKKKFFNAPICHDLSLVNYEFADATIAKKIISDEPVWELRSYLQILERELYLLADAINSYYGVERITKNDWIESKNRTQLMTMLYHLKLNSNVQIEECVESMKKICKVLDITELLGVTDAHYMLCGIKGLDKLNSERILSPRVSKLFAILKDLSQTSKILVFVKTRRVAHLLTNILKENPEINKKFCPLKIIGQSGPFGMSWLNEQDEVIEKFRHGNCNLLVSTSVLEEGIDNPDCDVVIRFDGVKSLISFTQSKGRARKWEKSQFILLMSEDEEKFLLEIQEHDTIVKKVLTNRYNDNEVPSKTTLRIQKEILNKPSPPPIQEFDCTLRSSECAVEFYLTGSHELFYVQERIADLLFTKYFLRVKLIDQANCNSLWKSRNIFPQEDSLLILGLKTLTPNIYQRYKLMCADWYFFLNKIQSSVWTRVVLPQKHGLEINSRWPMRMLSWGIFSDKQIFELKESFETDIDGTFEFFHSNSMQLILPISPQLIIDIPLTSIHRFILCNWTETDVTLYIPLVHCPLIRTSRGERRSCDNCVFLTYFADYPVVAISLRYTKHNWSQLWTFLHSSTIFPVPLFESRVEVHQSDKDEFITHSLSGDERLQNCIWHFSVLKSGRTICFPEETVANISWRLSHAKLENINAFNFTLSHLLLLISSTNTNYFFDVQRAFDDKFEQVAEQPDFTQSTNPPRNFRYIDTAMVTPSTIIPFHPFLTQCNRLYRKFPNEKYLNVAFCEEHGEPLKNADVIDRVKKTLVSGIVINGSSYHFLVSSGSQLRSKKAIFLHIGEDENAHDKIKYFRSQLMGNSVVNNETKYLTRLGLFCTSDFPACEIGESETLMLPDLFAANGDNLTDGNGKIRKSLAKKVLEDIPLKNNPTILDTTAIQIRLAGLKGVLTVVDDETDPDFKQGNPKCNILFRKSMKKIEWTDSALCVVKVGKYNKLFLNTQMLTLLTSLKDSSMQQWDPKIKLKAIFKQTLEYNAELFTNLETANFALTSQYLNYPQKTSQYFDILTEPYLISLLRCIYTYNIKNLIKRFHIPMRNGCILMGIPDPIGVLEDGEVFITYEEYPSERTLIRRLTGRILVYKNPCLHPGDLITPTAVDKEELHSLHNVIVFPIKGSRSIPACSGGGDLDGDEFAIIWDEDLIPPETATFHPLNYNQVLEEYTDKLNVERLDLQNLDGTQIVADRKVPIHLDENIQSILANSYCKVISNQLLGIISHYHVAISDLKEDGARDDMAIELAKLASLAVDAPKTGIFPTIPEKANKLIRDKGYPDFMEKTENTSYPSRKLLGEFYHEARAVCFRATEWQNILNYYSKRDFKQRVPGNVPINMFMISGHEVYIEDANKIYFKYTNALRTIMLSLGIETEAEVMLSLIIKCHPLLSADMGRNTRVLETATSHLIQEFREIFYKDTDSTEYKQKAAAWYLAAYQRQLQQSGELISLSFPWLVGEHLCEIVSIYQQPMPKEQDFHWLIGNSAREYILQHSDNIINLVEKKRRLLPNIESIINQYAAKFCKAKSDSETQDVFKVEAYGSVSKYLCELQSDLDICVSLTTYGNESIPEIEKFRSLDIRKQRKHLLKSFISPPLCCIANNKIEKFNVGFPFLNCTVDSPDERCTEMSVDITVDSDGVLKADYILQLYHSTGGLFFAFLWILIHWARHVGILKSSSPNSTCLLITAQFEALVLHIYNKLNCKPGPMQRDDLSSNLESIIDMLKNPDIGKPLGLMLEEFFWLGYQVTSRNIREIVYKWPIAGEPFHTIEKAALDTISGLLFQGWHCLAFTRDVAKLFEQTGLQLSFNKRFSSFMSNCLRTSTNFFENTLSNSTGAQVKIDVRDRYLYLTAHGSAGAIHKLAKEVSQIESSTAITNSFRSHINHYILEGSLALVMSGFPIKSKVLLDNFEHGLCREHHYRSNKNVIKSANGKLLDDWEKEAKTKIQSLLCNQLSHFPGSNPDMIRNLKLISRFGYFYILEGLDSFNLICTSLYLDEFEKCLLKDRNNRKFDSIEEDIHSLSEYFKCIQINTPKYPMMLEQTEIISKIDDKSTNLTKALSCAYCPGIKSTNGMSHTKSIFTKSLHQCGFVHEQTSKSITWMICIQVTLTRSVRIILDENLQLIDVSESPLVWMLATIIANRNELDPQKAHDIRLRVETSTSLDKNSFIYKTIFPDANNPSILTINNKGLPTVSDNISEKLKLIKHYNETEIYKLNNTTAKLTTGTEYCQQNLVVGREFCELSLYHNESQLREAVKSGNGNVEIKDIATEAVDISLKLSDIIYGNMD